MAVRKQPTPARMDFPKDVAQKRNQVSSFTAMPTKKGAVALMVQTMLKPRSAAQARVAMPPPMIVAPSAPEATTMTIRMRPLSQTAAVPARGQVVVRRNLPSLLRNHVSSPIAMMTGKKSAVLKVQKLLRPRNAALVRI